MSNLMRKIIVLLLVIGYWLFGQNRVLAQETVTINFFYSVTCPHCKKEQLFLDQIEKNYSDVVINRYEISKYSDLYQQLAKKYNLPLLDRGLVPLTLIQDRYFVGFNDQIGRQIELYLDQLTGRQINNNKPTENNSINLPVVGKVNIDKLALPILAILLGALDGFNVCSLGALLIILTLVLSLHSRRKIFIFGGTYLFTTALVYGLLIFFWYQLFNIITPFIRKIELVIGLITLIGGIYFFKEFLKAYKYGPQCEIDEGKKISGKFSVKFKQLIKENKKLLPIVFSILVFAATITVVEFPCSAAVPLVFAGILSKAKLAFLTYALYIATFVFFYLLDEIIVFTVAIFSMNLWLSSPKFVTWIILVQSIIMFILSFHYLFGLF